MKDSPEHVHAAAACQRDTAAEMHLAVAIPELLGPSDVCGVLCNAETLITGTLPIENGRASAPDRPGLSASRSIGRGYVP